MNIAIDARMIHLGSMHGIARYVSQLLQSLRLIGDDCQIFVLAHKENPLCKEKWPANIHMVHANSKWISLKEQWELPRVLKNLKIDVFHATSFVAPVFCPCPMVMTIHDLNHLVLPQYYTPIHEVYYRTIVKHCIKKSSIILTVSHFSKKEISQTLDIDPNKIMVTYNGVSPLYQSITDRDELLYVQGIYELPEQFIFCLSNNKPHKNVHQLVRAYCFAEVDIPLVLTCAPDKELISIAEGYGKKHLIYFAKFIAEEHLPAVYSLASLFVYPSTYEGFGLPPLEALSCGTPVVVSNCTSLPEVMGSFATLVNPFNFQDIAKGLKTALLTPTSKNNFSEEGQIYAKQFSWHKMAQNTLDVYKSCV